MRKHGGGDRAMLHGPKATVATARRLRKAMNWPEQILWRRLRQRPAGLKFRRQHPAGPYVLDFFCSNAMLAVEIDGLSHDLGEQPERDKLRDAWLRERGVEVVRLSAAEVTRDSNAAIDGLVAICLSRGNPLHHSPVANGPPPHTGEVT